MVRCLDGNKVRHLRQTVDNDPDGVISSAGLGKSDDEILTYVVPFLLGHFKGFKKSRGFFVLGFY